MSQKKIIFSTILTIFWSTSVLSCHKGGPMGFATNDPGGFSLDITLSPTYTGASTLGTLGCKNWDYTQMQKNHFLESQWTYLSEEASRGKGKNLTALAQIMGCSGEKKTRFATLIQGNYSALFGKSKNYEGFFNNLEILLLENRLNNCSS